ncbi:hypothetical protein FHS42_001587 [Streptomyces zagrosensis]|uniref:Uncharacterized protein n=1 Tax=Streptomyces zagrosensis TaxID=1042984 RepID=A0A7W9Q6N8_9ACTN|nr:hypothetical protein [Streptomyces zagrosensis]
MTGDPPHARREAGETSARVTRLRTLSAMRLVGIRYAPEG